MLAGMAYLQGELDVEAVPLVVQRAQCNCVVCQLNHLYTRG